MKKTVFSSVSTMIDMKCKENNFDPGLAFDQSIGIHLLIDSERNYIIY